ncbi:MAG: hypothetical protein K5829_06285 [Treponema sp.]|nr:hypothetical protein [Treponema sp.]
MKCKKIFVFLTAALTSGIFLFFSCKYDPETMIPMTAEEICSYMNQNFEGDFELIDKASTDNSEYKINTAYMKCSLFPNQTVTVFHGYWQTIFGWSKTCCTNYNDIYYKKELEKTYAELIENWFGAYEYKAVLSELSSQSSSQIKQFSTLKDYLASRPIIEYKVVLNTSDPSVKNYAEQKARSVSYDIRNQREYLIDLELYLWDDKNSFNNLSDSDLKDLEPYSNEYYYCESSMENYSE